MPKDRYYFSHDYNARNDRKIAALVRDYKSSGYGIFWATCELMHEEGGYLEFDELTSGVIAKDLNEDEKLVWEVLGHCISKYKLFSKDEIHITSNRVNTNLTDSKARKQAKVESGRLGGIKSGESRKSKQNEAPLQANEAPLEGTKQVKEVKESKGEKEKEVNFGYINLNEDSIIGKMKSVWLNHNPNYQIEEYHDCPALLNLAYKIAKVKKWEKKEVVNGKLEETTKIWEAVTKFIRNDDFYKKLELVTIEKRWTGLVQSMAAAKEKNKAIAPIRKERTPEEIRKQMDDWDKNAEF